MPSLYVFVMGSLCLNLKLKKNEMTAARAASVQGCCWSTLARNLTHQNEKQNEQHKTWGFHAGKQLGA
jgi:hypothetical protein